MLEVIDYLRANGFRTYIVTGGGQEFVRVYSNQVYGGPANGLPDTKVGTFSQSLMDEAKQRGWTVISMKNDWNRILPTDARPD